MMQYANISSRNHILGERTWNATSTSMLGYLEEIAISAKVLFHNTSLLRVTHIYFPFRVAIQFG